MPSVIAFAPPEMLEGELALGAVLPIAHYPETTGLGMLGHGGSLFVVTRTPDDAVWLIAVLEAPTRARIRIGDKRPAGWHAPANETPITDLTPLRKQLKLATSAPTRVLAAGAEAAIRALLDDEDAPVIGPAATQIEGGVTIDPEARPLVRAAGLVEAGRVLEAIDVMLEHWRQARDVDLANLIDRVTRLLPGHGRPLMRARTGDQDAWHEAFRDHRSNLPQLLQNALHDDLYASALARLATLPPDPRIAYRLAERLPASPIYGAAPFWHPWFAVLHAARDPRTFAIVAEFERDLAILDRANVRGVMTADAHALFELARPPVAAAKHPDLGAIVRACEIQEAPQRLEHELLDAIAQHPSDDMPIQVYADSLLERGHVRGEYLALACREHRAGLSAASARRLAVLAEVPYLFGALDDLATQHYRKRDRGIERTLMMYANATSLAWQTLAAEPLARVLTSITLIGRLAIDRVPAVAAFLRAAPALQVLEDVTGAAATALVAELKGAFVKKGDNVRRVAP